MNELPGSLVGWCGARVGATLCEKWKLDQLIDVGGMAAVYAATHRNGNRVAIKMLHPDAGLIPGVHERFLKEGYAANIIGHAGAVRVLDDDVDTDGSVFLVMELLEGENLQTRIERRGGRLRAEDVLCIMDRVLDVLVAAHEKGILHRDIKPENIFVTLGGDVKLLDFGIARVRQESMSIPTSTMPGVVLGTPGFLPPEQALGRVHEVDARSDVWAVGATMYAALSGHTVHEAETGNEQVVLAATQPVPSLGVVAPLLPRPLIELVDSALGYQREERWQSAAEMRAALREVFHAIQGFRMSRVDHRAVILPQAASLFGDDGAAPPHEPAPEPQRASDAPSGLVSVPSLTTSVPSLTLHGSAASTSMRARFGSIPPGARFLRGAGVPLAAAGLLGLAAVLGAALRASTGEIAAPAADAALVPAIPPSVSPAPEPPSFVPESPPPVPAAVPEHPRSAEPAPPQRPQATPSAGRQREEGRTGALTIDSAPASSVFLDGRPLGTTPKVNVKVPPGIHQVTFVHKFYAKKTVTLYVPDGGVKSAVVRLDKGPPPKR